MGRKPCCAKEGLNVGAWTAYEDMLLVSYINAHGEGKWRSLAKRSGLKRCGKSCRLRWLNYLRPGIKRGNISHEEEDLIIRLHRLLGNRWSLIAGRLPGRTDNEIKNYWNTTLGKKVHGGQVPSHDQQDLDPTPECSMEANVVQTKATRCTKTFFHQDRVPSILMPASSVDYYQHCEAAQSSNGGGGGGVADALVSAGEEDERGLQHLLDECNSMDFWVENDYDYDLGSVAFSLENFEEERLNWTADVTN